MFIKSTENKGTFTCDKDGKRLIKLIDDLWWGADRWDSSTEATMNEIADLLEMGKPEDTFKLEDEE